MSNSCLLLTLSKDEIQSVMHYLTLPELLQWTRTCKSIREDACARTVWSHDTKRVKQQLTLLHLDPEEGLKPFRPSSFFPFMSFSVFLQLFDFDDSRTVLRRLIHTLLMIPHTTELTVRQGMAWNFQPDEWTRIFSHSSTAHIESLKFQGSLNALPTILPLLGKYQHCLTRLSLHTHLPDAKLPADPNIMSDLRCLTHLDYLNHSTAFSSRPLHFIAACHSLQHLAVSQAMVQGTNLAWLFSQKSLQSLRSLKIAHAPPNVPITPPTRLEPPSSATPALLDEVKPFSLLTCLEVLHCDDVSHDFPARLLSLIGSDHELGFFTTGSATEIPKKRQPLQMEIHVQAVERKPGESNELHEQVQRLFTRTTEDLEILMVVHDQRPAGMYPWHWWRQEFEGKLKYQFYKKEKLAK